MSSPARRKTKVFVNRNYGVIYALATLRWAYILKNKCFMIENRLSLKAFISDWVLSEFLNLKPATFIPIAVEW